MSDEEASSEDDCYGPALPPRLQNQPKVIGPQLPPSLKKSRNGEEESKASTTITSAAAFHQDRRGGLPNNEVEVDDEEEDDDDNIGPYPPDDPRSHRVPKARISTPESASAPKREEWMLVPPKNKTISEVVGQIGLTQRKFLGRTPDEVKPPEDEEEELDFHEVAKEEFEESRERERDDRMEEMLKQSGSKGNESLLNLHRKRKNTVEDGPKERKPFNRDEDLKVGGLSQEEREKFIKKTSELGTRFRGGKRKFL